MPYLKLEKIEDFDEDGHLDMEDDEDWEEYAPYPTRKDEKIWVSRYKGMLRLARIKGTKDKDDITFFYRGYPLAYDPDWHKDTDLHEDATCRRGLTQPPWGLVATPPKR